ncbi:hypothetical protein GLOIN_2v1500202, partial [Rhizophagus irregularis DAOM 181602=DAOM 197198]
HHHHHYHYHQHHYYLHHYHFLHYHHIYHHHHHHLAMIVILPINLLICFQILVKILMIKNHFLVVQFLVVVQAIHSMMMM